MQNAHPLTQFANIEENSLTTTLLLYFLKKNDAKFSRIHIFNTLSNLLYL